jgi:hypothetical protein
MKEGSDRLSIVMVAVSNMFQAISLDRDEGAAFAVPFEIAPASNPLLFLQKLNSNVPLGGQTALPGSPRQKLSVT